MENLLSPTSLPPLPADQYNLSNLGNSAEPDDQIARARRLQHQKSLDFIQYAIKSATARRGGVAASASESEATGLGIAIDDEMEPTPTLSQLSTASGSSYTSASSNVASSIHTASTGPMNPICMPYVHPHDLLDLLAQQRSVDLDDAYDSDEEEPACDLKLNDDSIDDIDFVLGAARAEDQVAPAFGLKPRSQRQQSGSQARFEHDSMATTGPVAVKITPSSASEKEEEDDEEDEGDVTLTAIEPAATEASPTEQLRSDDKPSQRASKREGPSHKASGADLASRISGLPADEVAQGKVAPTMPKDQASSSGHGKMKKRTSFSFTTADAPLKVRNEAGKGTSVTPLPLVEFRAKARAEQIVEPSMLAPISAPSQKPSAKSSRRKGQKDRKASHESTSSTSSPPALSDGMSSPTSSLAPHDSASMTSSPASSVVNTPVSVSIPLPIEVVDGANQAFKAEMLAEVDVGKKMEVLTRTEVTTTPQKLVARLRGSVSLANMKQTPSVPKDDEEEVQSGLSHSSSTHNLRGAAVIVPSVRNKIAALENRQTTLRDFARGANGDESDVSAAPSLTPKKSSASINSTNSTPNAKAGSTTPGRVAQLAASAEAASTSPSANKGPSSPSRRSSGIPQSTSARQLVRKGSSLSINSSTSASTASSAEATPAYLKRQPSVLSFKAPVFKPAHVLKMEAKQQ